MQKKNGEKWNKWDKRKAYTSTADLSPNILIIEYTKHHNLKDYITILDKTVKANNMMPIITPSKHRVEVSPLAFPSPLPRTESRAERERVKILPTSFLTKDLPLSMLLTESSSTKWEW